MTLFLPAVIFEGSNFLFLRTMNKILFYPVIACLPFGAYAMPKDEKPYIQPQSAVVGHTAGNKQIVAAMCEFPEYIYRFSLDPDQHHAVIVLRGSRNGRYTNSGHLGAFDVTTRQLAWSLGIRNFKIGRTKNLIFYNSYNEPRYLNITDGTRASYASGACSFTDYNNDIGIAYGHGIDLFHNKQLWKRSSVNNAVAAVKYLNDTTVAMVAGGLHLLNIKTGEGWDYAMKTSKENVWTELAVGITTGIISGVSVMPNTEKTGVASNILYDSTGYLYIADRNNIACLNMTGKLVWETDISAKMSSASQLFIKGSNIYMLNKGYAQGPNGPVRTGRAFLAAFDRMTGQMVFVDTFSKNTVMTSYDIKGNTCRVLFEGNGITEVALTDGTTHNYELPEPSSKHPDGISLRGFLDDENTYMQDEAANFINIRDMFPGASFMVSLNDEIIIFSEKFEVKQAIPVRKAWNRYAVSEGKEIFKNPEQYIAIAANGKRLAILDPADENYVAAGTLYRVKGKALYMLPLKDITE